MRIFLFRFNSINFNIQGVPKLHVHNKGGDFVAYFMTKISYIHGSPKASLPIYTVLKVKNTIFQLD